MAGRLTLMICVGVVPFVVACGDDARVAGVGDDDAAAPVAAGDAARAEASKTDAADAAAQDAPYDGPGCANDRSPVSDECSVSRRCTSGECAAPDSFLYACRIGAGPSRPPLDGCNAHSGLNEWCCPAGCVPNKNLDALCSGAAKGFYCPNFGGGAAIVPAACTKVMQGVEQPAAGRYCCP